jgi:aminoglycoside 2'-N-acetyltransferase I
MGDVRIRTLPTVELTGHDIDAIRRVLTAAFLEDEHGGFTEEDWQHALGGTHFLLELDGSIVGHASVVERQIQVGGRPLRTGYVEAVAIEPARQRTGLGSGLMKAVTKHVDAEHELGVLGTGTQPFYERLGWEIWRGPSGVRTANGVEPTPDEDGYILVRRTPRSPALRPTDPITCEWRPGDVW